MDLDHSEVYLVSEILSDKILIRSVRTLGMLEEFSASTSSGILVDKKNNRLDVDLSHAGTGHEAGE